jgi:UDP-glucuronate decarboxylase
VKSNPILVQDIDRIVASLTAADCARLTGSTILVTGCAGFLGFCLLHALVGRAEDLGIHRLIGIDNFLRRRPPWLDALAAQSAALNICAFDIIHDRLEDVPGAAEADFVIHMASIASPVFYRQFPIETLDANVWGLRALLDFFRDKELRGLLFFSSSEVYGDPASECVPTTESYAGNVATIGPRACYDESKRFGETMCSLFAQKYGMPISIVRPFNNYGPGMALDDRRAPADFAKAVVEGRDIEILSDGSPTRTFCYVSDAISGYLKILLHGRFDVFNIGMDRPEISVRDLAEVYCRQGAHVFGYAGKTRFGRSPDSQYLAHNPTRRCPNINKARQLLGFAPAVGIEDGVNRFLEFLKHSGSRP